MKTTKLILTGLAATAALLSNSLAQSTVAVTDPVGYVTMPIAQKNGAAPGVSFVGPALVGKPEVQGEVAVAGSEFAVTLPSAPPAITNNSLGQPQYYFEIASGPNEGKWSNIASAAGNVLTLVDDFNSDVIVGTKFIIRKHHTFNSLFGDTEATCSLVTGLDANSADELQILGENPNPAILTLVPTSYFFSTDDLGVLGWVNVTTGLAAGDETIAPGDGIKIIRRTASVKAGVVQVGHVKTNKTQFIVEPGTNYVTVPLGTGWSAADEAAVIASGPWTAGLDASTADTFELFSNSSPSVYFLSNDDLNPGLLPGPLTAGEGTAMRIVRKGAAFTMTFPAQFIQQ